MAARDRALRLVHGAVLVLCVGVGAGVGCGARTGLNADVEPRDVPAIDARDAVALEAAVPLDGPAVCGNGVWELGEECDDGARNAVGHAFGYAIGAGPEVPLVPLYRDGTAASFYAYRSASAHTGLEAALEANLFLHAGRGDALLSLFFFAGVDGDDVGPLQPDSAMTATFEGVPSGAVVALSDDSGECAVRSAGRFTGDWVFTQNTDGCVLTRLSWTSEWVITVRPEFIRGVSRSRLRVAEGSAVDVPLTESVRIFHHVTPTCHPGCVRARCGDGALDPGELCDDGNTTGGDGCAANCAALR